jgi:hypothetical protein
MVLTPPSIALGLNSFRLAILHMFSLGLRVGARYWGSPSAISRLATRLVQHWKPRLAWETSFGASYGYLALLCVLVRTERYW